MNAVLLMVSYFPFTPVLADTRVHLLSLRVHKKSPDSLLPLRHPQQPHMPQAALLWATLSSHGTVP